MAQPVAGAAGTEVLVRHVNEIHDPESFAHNPRQCRVGWTPRRCQFCPHR
jgi:hypothetical protein